MTNKLRKIEANLTNRVETGPVQFDDDWPGTFIRGDNAAYYAVCLSHVLSCIENGEKPNWLYQGQVEGLLQLLRGSHITNIEEDDNSDVGC